MISKVENRLYVFILLIYIYYIYIYAEKDEKHFIVDNQWYNKNRCAIF